MKTLNHERKKLYDNLEKKLVNTPLEKYRGEVPNGNSIWIKRQCDSLFGSHYDLPYLNLFKHYESIGAIKPGDKIFETTSGSAGISVAGIGKLLGYECHIAIPDGGEKVRVEDIKKNGGIVYLTEKNKYVNGFLGFAPRFLAKNRDIFYLNHSMGKTKKEINEITISSMEKISRESLESLNSNGKDIDYFVPAIGNGSSLLGPGRVFDKSKTKVIGFEPFMSGLAYDLVYPGKYEEVYGIKPGSLPKQGLPGMSFQIKGRHTPIPAIKKAVKENILKGVVLVSDEKNDRNYFELTGKKLSEDLPHWDKNLYGEFGRSTQAGIQVSKKLAKDVSNKNFLIIGYDKIERYDKWK